MLCISKVFWNIIKYSGESWQSQRNYESGITGYNIVPLNGLSFICEVWRDFTPQMFFSFCVLPILILCHMYFFIGNTLKSPILSQRLLIRCSFVWSQCLSFHSDQWAIKHNIKEEVLRWQKTHFQSKQRHPSSSLLNICQPVTPTTNTTGSVSLSWLQFKDNLNLITACFWAGCKRKRCALWSIKRPLLNTRNNGHNTTVLCWEVNGASQFRTRTKSHYRRSQRDIL